MFDILVIDDEPVPRQSWFRAKFESLGWSVASAHTGAQADALLRSRKFHLAFFDHDLGEDRDTGSTVATRILMEPETYRCPLAVWVHSANPIGAENIASKFRSAGVPTVVAAFGQLEAIPLQQIIENLIPACDCAHSTEP